MVFVLHTSYEFSDLKPTLHSWDKSYFIFMLYVAGFNLLKIVLMIIVSALIKVIVIVLIFFL